MAVEVLTKPQGIKTEFKKKPKTVNLLGCAKCRNTHTTLIKHTVKGKTLYYCKKCLEKIKKEEN